MLTGASRASKKLTNGARIGMRRYVMVQRIPDTTIAVVVERRAPKTAVWSTASPTRNNLRTNRSAGRPDRWRFSTTLMGPS